VLEQILSNPVTGYILSFGSLGLGLMLALNALHKAFALSDKAWGALTLLCGAIGGLLLQAVGLVSLPGGSPLAVYTLAVFVGAMCAAAAAGFSAVDLRATILKQKDPNE